MTRLFPLLLLMALAACSRPSPTPAATAPAATAIGAGSQASDYFDNTGRDDVLGGGVRMIPITTPKGTFNVWTKRVGNNPTIKVLLLHGGPGGHARVLRGVRQLLPRRRHRVLLLRPAGLGLQRPARRALALGAAALRRRSRAGAPGARARPRQLLPARAVLGRHPGHRVRAQVPAAPQGPGDLEHDVEHPGLQRVRARRADAGDGPGGAGGDQGDSRRRRTTRIRATWNC